uniref:Uncharacterized protein n=1 Tax=Timema monikensis TaxID=170555 RepID=A0A7R9HRX3_9NEOP|nr:unnamed protein product [Timema monikensis]
MNSNIRARALTSALQRSTQQTECSFRPTGCSGLDPRRPETKNEFPQGHASGSSGITTVYNILLVARTPFSCHARFRLIVSRYDNLSQHSSEEGTPDNSLKRPNHAVLGVGSTDASSRRMFSNYISILSSFSSLFDFRTILPWTPLLALILAVLRLWLLKRRTSLNNFRISPVIVVTKLGRSNSPGAEEATVTRSDTILETICSTPLLMISSNVPSIELPDESTPISPATCSGVLERVATLYTHVKTYASELGMKKLNLQEVYPHLSEARVKTHFGKNILSTLDRDSNPNLPAICNIVQHERYPLTMQPPKQCFQVIT